MDESKTYVFRGQVHRHAFPHLAAVLRTGLALMSDDASELRLDGLHISDPAACIADIDTLVSLQLPDDVVRGWISMKTKSFNGDIEPGRSVSESLARVREQLVKRRNSEGR